MKRNTLVKKKRKWRWRIHTTVGQVLGQAQHINLAVVDLLPLTLLRNRKIPWMSLVIPHLAVSVNPYTIGWINALTHP
jgi:hypothetical protein